MKLKYIEPFTYQHQGEGGKHTMDIKETKQEKRIKTKGAVEKHESKLSAKRRHAKDLSCNSRDMS